jgi:hypothetical protein
MKALMIRPYRNEDEQEVIDLWFACRLVVPANNPKRDIERKLLVNPELFLVGGLDKQIVATCMAGYEGHRGWIPGSSASRLCHNDDDGSGTTIKIGRLSKNQYSDSCNQ